METYSNAQEQKRALFICIDSSIRSSLANLAVSHKSAGD
jgi:hypothetical protein